MSVTFTKLFSSITESTIWCEPSDTRIVWITMLAMADRKGRVFGSVPGLANRSQVPVQAVRDALQSFLSPDPDSRTKDHEGRRIEPLADGAGWLLLNHAKYRQIRDDEERRAYKTEKQREYRKPVDNVDFNGPPLTVEDRRSPEKTDVEPNGHNAEADAEADTNKTPSAIGGGRRSANEEGFDVFWKAYPRKVAKGEARRAFQKHRCHVYLTEILAAVQMQRGSMEWRKDGGQFIPHPATWLNAERWNDESSIAVPPSSRPGLSYIP